MVANHVIIHLPHSSDRIPTQGFGTKYVIDPRDEAKFVTDWYTDELFAGHQAVRFDMSRVYCDVERLIPDPLDAVGQGFAYERTLDGQVLRHNSHFDLDHIRGFYTLHHHRLVQAIEEAVSLMPVVLIDAHSYSAKQADLSGYEGDPRALPDICLGYDEGRMPEGFLAGLRQQFETEGWRVGFNTPYSGSILPKRYASHPDVHSIMFEVSKHLYLEPGEIAKNSRFDEVRRVIQRGIEFAAAYDFSGA